MTFFDKPGEIMKENSYRVFQSFNNGTALAYGYGDCGETFREHSAPADNENNNSHIVDTVRNIYFGEGISVLIYNENGDSYYDDQIISAPKNKCFRQIGIYRYKTPLGFEKTVPIVMLMDK